MSDDLEEFIQAQKVKLAQARRSHGVKSPQPLHGDVNHNQSAHAQRNETTLNRPTTTFPEKERVPVNNYAEGGLNLGDYESKKRLYQEERKAETRNFLAKGKQSSKRVTYEEGGQPGQGESGLAFRDTSVERKLKEVERNKEYNQFIATNSKQPLKSRKSDEEFDSGTTVGGSYFPNPDKEHEIKLRNERNREYNEFLRQKEERDRLKKSHQQQQEQPQKRVVYQPEPPPEVVPPAVMMPVASGYGGGQAAYPYYGQTVPDYNELLRQKMELEQKYRSAQPPADHAPRAAGVSRRLQPVDDLEARMQSYDFELGKRKQRLKDDSSNYQQNMHSRADINDPTFMMDPGKYMGGDMFLDDRLMSQFGRSRGEDPSMRLDNLPRGNHAHPPHQPPAPSRFVGGAQQGGYGPLGGTVTAPGGPPDPNYEKKRKQQEYKQQLEAQIHAHERARKIEKEKNLQINLTGDKDPSRYTNDYMRTTGVSREPVRSEMPRNMPPPTSAPHIDQPLDLWSSGGGGVGVGPTSYDPNYQYYANADPLDPMVVPRSMPGMDMANAYGANNQNYQNDLLNQMREKQEREQRQKVEHEKWERKKDAEETYFPFGKGGGGAPLKDADGKIIADLRELHHIAETSKQPMVGKHEYHGQLTDVTSSRQPPLTGGGGGIVSSRDHTAPQFARGKIFNDPVSQQHMTQQEQYKLDLKRQMEERNRLKEEEKKRQAEEDAREEARIKQQMAQIQAEYEKEQEKIRRKAEEQQKKNEEMRHEAEQKRLAAERARKEAEEKQAEERRQEMQRELDERRRQQQQQTAYQKPASPPLPAQQPPPQRGTAPPPSNRAPVAEPPKPAPPTQPQSPEDIPTHPVRLTKARGNPERDQSRAEVNRQLSAMRKQLQSEQRRIEMQIDNKNYYQDGSHGRPDKRRVDNVFERGIKGPNDVDHYGFSKREVRERSQRQQPGDMILTEPAKVRRPTQMESWKPIFKDEPNEAALDLFMHSKYDPLTRSRDNFRQEFPNAPQSSDMLEVQQRELIRQQERELMRLRQVDGNDSNLGEIREDDLAFLIDHPDVKSMPLASDSAYIGMNGETLVPTPPLMNKIEKMRDRRKMASNKPSTPPMNIGNESKVKDLLPSPPSSAGGLLNNRRGGRSDSISKPANNFLDTPDVDDVHLPFEPFQAEKSFSKDDYMQKQLPNPDSLSLASNFSFDVDAVARKNKERLKKLDNSNDDDDLSVTDPDEILRKFVDRDLNPKTVRPMSTMTTDSDPDWLKPS